MGRSWVIFDLLQFSKWLKNILRCLSFINQFKYLTEHVAVKCLGRPWHFSGEVHSIYSDVAQIFDLLVKTDPKNFRGISHAQAGRMASKRSSKKKEGKYMNTTAHTHMYATSSWQTDRPSKTIACHLSGRIGRKKGKKQEEPAASLPTS